MAKVGHSPKAILKYMIWAAWAGIKNVLSLNLVDVFEKYHEKLSGKLACKYLPLKMQFK